MTGHAHVGQYGHGRGYHHYGYGGGYRPHGGYTGCNNINGGCGYPVPAGGGVLDGITQGFGPL